MNENPRNIVVVDSDPHNRLQVVRALTRMGHSVRALPTFADVTGRDLAGVDVLITEDEQHVDALRSVNRMPPGEDAPQCIVITDSDEVASRLRRALNAQVISRPLYPSALAEIINARPATDRFSSATALDFVDLGAALEELVTQQRDTLLRVTRADGTTGRVGLRGEKVVSAAVQSLSSIAALERLLRWDSPTIEELPADRLSEDSDMPHVDLPAVQHLRRAADAWSRGLERYGGRTARFASDAANYIRIEDELPIEAAQLIPWLDGVTNLDDCIFNAAAADHVALRTFEVLHRRGVVRRVRDGANSYLSATSGPYRREEVTAVHGSPAQSSPDRAREVERETPTHEGDDRDTPAREEDAFGVSKPGSATVSPDERASHLVAPLLAAEEEILAEVERLRIEIAAARAEHALSRRERSKLPNEQLSAVSPNRLDADHLDRIDARRVAFEERARQKLSELRRESPSTSGSFVASAAAKSSVTADTVHQRGSDLTAGDSSDGNSQTSSYNDRHDGDLDVTPWERVVREQPEFFPFAEAVRSTPTRRVVVDEEPTLDAPTVLDLLEHDAELLALELRQQANALRSRFHTTPSAQANAHEELPDDEETNSPTEDALLAAADNPSELASDEYPFGHGSDERPFELNSGLPEDLNTPPDFGEPAPRDTNSRDQTSSASDELLRQLQELSTALNVDRDDGIDVDPAEDSRFPERTTGPIEPIGLSEESINERDAENDSDSHPSDTPTEDVSTTEISAVEHTSPPDVDAEIGGAPSHGSSATSPEQDALRLLRSLTRSVSETEKTSEHPIQSQSAFWPPTATTDGTEDSSASEPTTTAPHRASVALDRQISEDTASEHFGNDAIPAERGDTLGNGTPLTTEELDEYSAQTLQREADPDEDEVAGTDASEQPIAAATPPPIPRNSTIRMGVIPPDLSEQQSSDARTSDASGPETTDRMVVPLSSEDATSLGMTPSDAEDLAEELAMATEITRDTASRPRARQNPAVPTPRSTQTDKTRVALHKVDEKRPSGRPLRDEGVSSRAMQSPAESTPRTVPKPEAQRTPEAAERAASPTNERAEPEHAVHEVHRPSPLVWILGGLLLAAGILGLVLADERSNESGSGEVSVPIEVLGEEPVEAPHDEPTAGSQSLGVATTADVSTRSMRITTRTIAAGGETAMDVRNTALQIVARSSNQPVRVVPK